MAANRPPNTYELIGLIKGLTAPKMATMALHLKQQILINILLSHINNSAVTAEVFRAGFDSISDSLRTSINQPIPPPK